MKDKFFHLDEKSKKECFDLLNDIFPIYRTLMGDGYKKTLSFHNYQNRVNKLDKFIRYKLYNENL